MVVKEHVTEVVPPQKSVPIRRYEVAKRALDIVLGATLLVLTAPLWPLIALAIKLDSRGPVLFRQRRVGRDLQQFSMLKFRSMVQDADPRAHQEAFRRYATGSPVEIDAYGPRFKPARDPRVTRVGRLLRATSLDELPQLINVLHGEMSIVGPRPAIPYELEWYRGWHLERFSALPGITGLWQVTGRDRTGFEQVVEMDVEYVRRRSLLLDLRIITLTLPSMLWPPRANSTPGREESR